MKKIWMACGLGAAVVMAPVSMDVAVAGDRGGAVAAGVIGGMALGALAAGAMRPAYEAEPIYVDPPPRRVYMRPPPTVYADPECYLERRRVWDGYAYTMRSVRVCP